MSSIFVNYRRDDSAGYAGRLRDRLAKRFGEDQVFIDIKTIEPGEDAVEAVDKALQAIQVLLVVIGKQWLIITDSSGKRRLDDPQDFVRLEIAGALRRNIKIIPILVGTASMPSVADLPEEIKPLARRNAVVLTDRNFHENVDELLQSLEKDLSGPAFASSVPSIPMPKVKQGFTDKQRKDFLYESFDFVKSYFKSALKQLESSYPNIEASYVEVNNLKFTCEVFVGGTSKNRCKIWVGRTIGDEAIGYIEDRFDINNDSSWNEMISVRKGKEGLFLDLPLSRTVGYVGIDISNSSTPQEAAEVLWRRFTYVLS